MRKKIEWNMRYFACMFILAFLVLFIPCLLINSVMSAMEHRDAVKQARAEQLTYQYIDYYSRNSGEENAHDVITTFSP